MKIVLIMSGPENLLEESNSVKTSQKVDTSASPQAKSAPFQRSPMLCLNPETPSSALCLHPNNQIPRVCQPLARNNPLPLRSSVVASQTNASMIHFPPVHSHTLHNTISKVKHVHPSDEYAAQLQVNTQLNLSYKAQLL